LLNAAQDKGVTLLLTALTPNDCANLNSWRDGLSDPALKASIRLLSPGRYVWPGGFVRFPLGVERSSDALSNIRPVLEDVLVEAGRTAIITHDPAEDFLICSGGGDIDEDLRSALFKAGNASETGLSFDPALPLEGSTDSAGGVLSVLAPDAPSTSWFDAITRLERLDPASVAILETPGKAGQILSSVSLKLRQSQAELAGSRIEPDSEAPQINDQVGPEDTLAARIAAPSQIHFIDRWTEDNRRFVRAGFWEATEQASKNLKSAMALLNGLNPQTYGRARSLVQLYGRSDGSQLCDDFSGAICFAPGFYEFDLVKPTGRKSVDKMVGTLKAYFDEKLEDMPFDRPLLCRRLFSNSLVLLRGEGYYANLKQTPPWDRAKGYMTEADALSNTLRILLLRPQDLDHAFKACLTPEGGTQAAWKLLVATLDQARNLGLIMLSIAMHQWRRSDKTWEEVDLVKGADELVALHYRVMLGDTTLIGSKVLRTVRDAVERASTELKHLMETETARARLSDWYEPGQPIRGWREADNPFENLLLGLLASASIPLEGPPAAALGIFWGGVELPIATRVAAKALDRPLDLHGFVSMGRYSGSAAKDDGVYCDLSTGEFRNFETLLDQERSKVLLLDDNALSGQTLESVRDLLLSYRTPEVETWVVRFSGERREGQMRMANSGVVQPAYLVRRLQGCLGETPYARSYSRKQYENPVGVFNVARSRILRYLHSNGFASIFEREGF